MSENKFIKRLKGEQTAKSVLEIKNESAKTSFANMPQGTSNAINVYSDHRGNATAVLEGTDIWKLNTSQFVVVPNAFGDGRDFTSTYTVFGSSLWVNATYTFDQPKIFTGATQWTLKLCGHSLLSSLSSTIGFSLIIKFGNAVTITKSFSVSESAFEFCKEFIVDFSESEQTAIKVANGDTMTVQLLCADATASATIYNGMTTLVAQQRRVDSEAVASDLHTFEDLEVEVAQLREDLDDLEEYVDDTFVRIDGESIMTGPLKMRATSSFQCAIAPYWDGVGFYKLNSDNSVTLIASIETPDGFLPWTTNTYNIGSSVKKWKDLYLAGSAYIAKINNGYDIAVPVTNSADTFALVNADITPLQQQVSHLQTIGRFLSFWDATTGLAQTNPQTSPYVYQTGDYFRVGVVAGPGRTNYKPSGSSYTIGVASTVVETERLSVGQVYYYDGANWALAAGGSVAIDETTIVFDSDDKIQAVATVNQNTAAGATNPVYNWVGTLAEYNAQNIETLHPDWLCYITDDVGGGESVYTKSQVDTIASGKANVDMDNLTAKGANIANWSSNVSNCITNVPQDIKLELNAGTLTLKAGSKVYVPNGVGSFDELIIQNDLTTITTWGQQVQLGLFVKSDGSTMFIINMEERCSSGSSAPTATNTQMWYDTTNNLVKRYAGGSDTGDRYSLPIALVQKGDAVESSNISSIDQVFNGFGYIGSTVFALPGVKVVIPDGRNTDGTLKNINITISAVTTYTENITGTNNVVILSDGSINLAGTNYWTYNEYKNTWVHDNNTLAMASIARSNHNTTITSFTPKTVFHALDYSDTEHIAHQATPSSRYVDLTAPAHGGVLTAPADGWFVVRGWAGEGAYVWLQNGTNGLGQTAPTGNQYSLSYCSLPVKKGDVIQVGYYGGTLTMCRFVYANGAQ
jgi:hypothetical protein